MKTLKQIVDAYAPVLTKLGEEEDDKRLQADIAAIREELSALIKANNRKISLFTVSIIAVIVLCALLTIVFINQGNLSWWANICTVTGVAPLTLVGFVRDWWKDKINADTLLRMIDSLDTESFYSVLAVFVNLLKK